MKSTGVNGPELDHLMSDVVDDPVVFAVPSEKLAAEVFCSLSINIIAGS